MYSKVAARWWTDAIRLSTKAGNAELAEELLANFQSELDHTIRGYIERQKEVYLVSKYRPDAILSEVANKVGMDLSAFSMKAFMHIAENSVRVRVGNSQSFTTIYCLTH